MEFWEKVRVALALKEVKLDCESCGRQEWKIGAGELGNLWVLLPLVTEHGHAVEAEGQRGGMTVCPMICNHCGFTRLYTLQVLMGDDWSGFGEEGA